MITLIRPITVPTEIHAMLQTQRPELAKTLTRRLTIKEQQSVVDALVVHMETLGAASCEIAELKTLLNGIVADHLPEIQKASKESYNKISTLRTNLAVSVNNLIKKYHKGE